MTPDRDSVEERRRWNAWCHGATIPELRGAVRTQTGVYKMLAERHIAHRETTVDLAQIRQIRSGLSWEIVRLVSQGDTP